MFVKFNSVSFDQDATNVQVYISGKVISSSGLESTWAKFIYNCDVITQESTA